MTPRRLAKYLSFRLFNGLEKAGLHVLPVHYYTPIPDHRWLRSNRHLWAHKVPLSGVTWDLQAQLLTLSDTCSRFYDEVRGLKRYQEFCHRGLGPGFGPIESQLLHCTVRSRKPSLIIEVGSGVSTACMRHAADLNEAEGSPSKLLAIDPYPASTLEGLQGVQLLRQMVQGVDAGFFSQLQHGDMLFIDSSHAVKTGSDVNYLTLEILPLLAPGVLIHIHDIYLPYLHSPTTLQDYLGWQETSLVLALLSGNQRLAIRIALAGLCDACPNDVRTIMTDYRPTYLRDGLSEESLYWHELWGRQDEVGHLPCSLWIESQAPQS